MNSKLIVAALLLLLLPFELWAQQESITRTPLKSVVRFAPMSIFYGGVGGGISYEHFLDKDRKISLMLPLTFGLRGYLIGDNSGALSSEDLNYSVLFNPGIRMYPKGQRRLSYAIGASFFTTYGSENGFKRDNSSGAYNMYTKGTEMRLGSIISNSLTVNLSKRFNVGVEALVGCSFKTFYKDKSTNTMLSDAVKAMGGFSVQLGYRF